LAVEREELPQDTEQDDEDQATKRLHDANLGAQAADVLVEAGDLLGGLARRLLRSPGGTKRVVELRQHQGHVKKLIGRVVRRKIIRRSIDRLATMADHARGRSGRCRSRQRSR
jgi:hypothetical protein